MSWWAMLHEVSSQQDLPVVDALLVAVVKAVQHLLEDLPRCILLSANNRMAPQVLQ